MSLDATAQSAQPLHRAISPTACRVTACLGGMAPERGDAVFRIKIDTAQSHFLVTPSSQTCMNKRFNQQATVS